MTIHRIRFVNICQERSKSVTKAKLPSCLSWQNGGSQFRKILVSDIWTRLIKFAHEYVPVLVPQRTLCFRRVRLECPCAPAGGRGLSHCGKSVCKGFWKLRLRNVTDKARPARWGTPKRFHFDVWSGNSICDIFGWSVFISVLTSSKWVISIFQAFRGKYEDISVMSSKTIQSGKLKNTDLR